MFRDLTLIGVEEGGRGGEDERGRKGPPFGTPPPPPGGCGVVDRPKVLWIASKRNEQILLRMNIRMLPNPFFLQDVN